MIPNKNILITKFPFRSKLGGVENHTFQLVENLEGRGMRFFLLSSCSVMLSEFRKKGWKNIRWWLGLAPINKSTKWLFIFTWPFLVVSGVISLIMMQVRFKIDKLYCLTLPDKLILTPIAKFLGIKVIWLEHLSVEDTVNRNIYKFLYKWWSGFVQVVVISEFVKNELQEMGITENVSVIYHGVDLEKYKKQEDLFEVMAERRSGDYDKRNYTIGCVCKLEKVKGLEYLIRAIDMLKEKVPEIDLIIVGEGSQRQNLQWLIETLNLQNKVKLVGYKDNFLDWIHDFDVFALASLKESLGISLIEAIACRIPVIGTSSGGVTEVIEHGKSGILVEPASPKELAKAIMLYYKEPDFIGKFTDNAYWDIADKFSLEKMLREYERLLLS